MKALNILQISIKNQTFATIFTPLTISGNEIWYRLLYIDVSKANFLSSLQL